MNERENAIAALDILLARVQLSECQQGAILHARAVISRIENGFSSDFKRDRRFGDSAIPGVHVNGEAL